MFIRFTIHVIDFIHSLQNKIHNRVVLKSRVDDDDSDDSQESDDSEATSDIEVKKVKSAPVIASVKKKGVKRPTSEPSPKKKKPTKNEERRTKAEEPRNKRKKTDDGPSLDVAGPSLDVAGPSTGTTTNDTLMALVAKLAETARIEAENKQAQLRIETAKLDAKTGKKKRK